MRKQVFVTAAATISHQPTFGQAGFSDHLKPLEAAGDIFHPDYKNYLDPVLLRRMSKLLRMGVSTAIHTLKQADIAQPGGIIIGTGLGCLLETEKFLTHFLTLKGLLPPTSFILSTHNTVAGQISLALGCHAYNMTHTQSTVSFEMAVLDGILKVREGSENILVGAADEYIPFLDRVAQEWRSEHLLLTSGASCFMFSGNRSSGALAEILDVSVQVNTDSSPEDLLKKFLETNKMDSDDISAVFSDREQPGLPTEFDQKLINYIAYSGVFPTASAFGFHFGLDWLQKPENRKSVVLVLNSLRPGSVGLTLLKGVEV